MTFLLSRPRLLISLSYLIFSTMSNPAFGKGKKWGAGVQVIDVTGFTVKKNISGKKAVEAALAWDNTGDQFQITASGAWLTIWPDFLILGDDKMDGVLGGGVRLSSRNSRIELRVPTGLSWMILDERLEIFGYLIPGMTIYPKTDLSVSMVLGCRYFF